MNTDFHELLAAELGWLAEKFGKVQTDWYLFPFSNTRRPVDPPDR